MVIVNNLDDALCTLFNNRGTEPALVLEHHAAMLKELCEELKEFAPRGITGDAFRGILDECLHLATRELDDESLPWWDEDIADNLLGVVKMADDVIVYRKAKSWAASRYWDDWKLRVLFEKVEAEYKKIWFFVGEIECLNLLAHQILVWLTARLTLISEYKNK